MKISTRGRYAIRFMVDLAMLSAGEPVKIKDAANRQQISEKYLEQIASILCKAGMIKSIRGPRGGYVLNIAAEKCTVGNVLRLTENNFEMAPCVNDSYEECGMIEKCTVRKMWINMDRSISKLLDSITLEDILNDTVDLKCEL